MSATGSLEQQALALLETALEQPSPERVAWIRAQAGQDEALIQRVISLLEMDSSAGATLRTGGASRDVGQTPAPDHAGPYRITELIARGGMGAVYKGERDTGDFEQTVAIKIIRPGVLSDSLIARFEMERQILAKLSHPNIASLFDGGALEDRSPYIAMEFVDGDPITQWCDTANLGLDDRLWLFQDVCAAVQYAHQNLIVHRDITPSNILVTKAGQIKLIDFGIAKPQSNVDLQDDTQDAPGKSLASLSFTPGYAAPERAKGALANTLSDLYSLGKLLEDLVQDLPASADIAAIIAKASAHDIASRYASVDALIDDLKNYRTKKPVDARNGGAGYRFSKFFQRNRLLMTLGAVSVLGLTIALVITQYQYNRAEAALFHANERFEQARGLSKAMITDVYDAIEHIPGTLEVRENLAGIVKTYIDGLASDPNAPDNVLLDVAIQNTRLSDLYGGLGVANLGDTETSYVLLLRAEQALSRLLEQSPDDVNAIDEMVWVKRLKSNQEMTYQLDMAAAQKTNAEGLALAERGLTFPGSQETRLYFRLWNSRTDRVKILMYENDYDTAISEARRYREELAASNFEEEPRRRNSRLGYFARLEGEALADRQRWEEAIPPLVYAVSAYDTILEEDRSSYYYNLQKMTALGPLVMSYLKLERGEDALLAARGAVELAETLRDGDPMDASGRGYVATQLEMLARVQASFGEPSQAQSTITGALDIRRAVITDFQDTLGHRRDLAGALKTAGVVYQTIDMTETACSTWREALSVLDQLETKESLTEIERDVWKPEILEHRQAADCPE